MKILKAVPAAGYCITIYFDNHHSVTLDMKSKLETVRFSSLRDEQVFCAARTDGKAVYWPRGISMAVSEIIELIAK
ncbi:MULTISPECIES: DUF2442 domain-containing protein [Sporomusaceae]|uniref:DUF2442 domain-containing protein n=1 Tax=Pelosinus propionicus DSM 13327 TaxID=1123291 RepID=A0A1I4MBV4_9FIRM|nr:DUF2442 domain-containing protein [Pelosinus propionicus]SFM00741.1 Protein of unknown function [Pelosinus propionicus DSM 13327]